MLEVTMVLGGSGSGKSTYAEALAQEMEQKYGAIVYYLATGTVWDDEFADRVAKHRLRRPAAWQTIEEAHDLAGALGSMKDPFPIILVDGIGTWLGNLMYQGVDDEFAWSQEQETRCWQSVRDFVRCWEEMNGIMILVADEVGMEIVPASYPARIFCDFNGQVNQLLAQNASAVYLVVAGIPVCLKGGIRDEKS